jgi:hypothetical protein
LPAIGLDGQERIVSATVGVVGDDLTAEVVARSLAAAGAGRLRLVRRSGPPSPAVTLALAGSNPDVVVETVAWPSPGQDPGRAGAGWVAALAGCAVVVRSGFDDDAMLRAAVRLGVPVVVVRAGADEIDVVSFRRQGPCPHVSLEVAVAPASSGGEPSPLAVAAGHTAAAEAVLLLAGAERGPERARHLRLPLDGTPPRSTAIPWTPECFACGGSAAEMTFQ